MKLRIRIFPVVLLLAVLAVPLANVALAGSVQQVQFVAPKLVVNTSFLNVRTGPGVQYSVLITVVGGTELPVLGIADDGVWFQVSTVVGTGWVNVEFTLPRGNFENVPVVDFSAVGVPVVVNLPTTIGLPGQGGGGAVIGQPVTTTTTITTAPVSGGLIRVQLENGEFTTVASGERFRVAIVTGDPVNLRTQPAINAPAIGIVFPDPARDYAIVGRSVDRGGLEWLAIDVPGMGSGWIEAPKALLRLSGAYREVVFTNIDAPVFAAPGSGGNVNIPFLSRGTEGFVAGISQDSNFVLLELGGGDRLWVPFDSVTSRTGTTTDGLDLAASQPVPVAAPSTTTTTATTTTQPSFIPSSFGLDTPHIVINASSLNVRSGPGAQYTSLAVVPGGTELPVLGLASDGVWFLIAGPFGQGWVNNEFVLFRGAIQNVPIIPLSSVSGVLATPTAVVSGAVTLYAAPGTNFGAIGTLSGPIEVQVVARTADFAWVQLNTSLGFGWVPASQVSIRGDATLIPIVG